MCQELVEREHVRFLGSKKYVVGQVLDDFGYQSEATSHFLGWHRSDETLDFGGDDGWAEEPEEYEGPNGSVFGVLKSWHHSCRYLAMSA